MSLGGPVLWFFLVLVAIALVGAIYQIVDLVRRGDRDYGRWGRIVWLPLPVIFVFGLLFAFIGVFLEIPIVAHPEYGGFLFFAMFANLIQLPTYLLRVVFPTPARAVDRSSEAGEHAPDWACDALADQGEDVAAIPGCEPDEGSGDTDTAEEPPTI